MDTERMSQFISELRKEKKMTQKELAEHLGITDKAVSKWERGLSCPDISLLSSLAEILGVTAGELLNGQRTGKQEGKQEDETSQLVETTLAYADTAAKSRIENVRFLSAAIFTGLFVCGIFVCIICDYAITRKLTWSWYPIYSAVFGWMLIIPLIMSGKKGIRTSLILLTLLLIPYFFCINTLLDDAALFIPISIGVSIPSLVLLWLAYFLFVKSGFWLFASTAICILAASVTGLLIECIIDNLLKQPVTLWDILAYPPMVLLSLLVLAVGYHKKKSFRRMH